MSPKVHYDYSAGNQLHCRNTPVLHADSLCHHAVSVPDDAGNQPCSLNMQVLGVGNQYCSPNTRVLNAGSQLCSLYKRVLPAGSQLCSPVTRVLNAGEQPPPQGERHHSIQRNLSLEEQGERFVQNSFG